MKLAIKGHPTRGKEVIELLEMLGGKNPNCTGNCSSAYYHIDDGLIKVDCIVSNHCLYTLEQFEQMYPYKVGEKVLYKYGNTWVEAVIAKIRWSEVKNSIFYVLNTDTKTTIFPEYLKPMKKKELKDYLKPGYVIEHTDGYKFVITQDVHGNNFGLQIGAAVMWDSLDILDYIVKVYQIDRPGALHKTYVNDTHLTLVWEKPKEVELTMQQIADKFGIDVNQLKIKK